MNLKEKIDNLIDTKLLPFIFKISDQPMLFSDLLIANKAHQEGMKPESAMLGFRFRKERAYFFYVILWHLVLGPPALALHGFLATMDCHAMIILAVLFTGVFFATFLMFSEWIQERMTVKLIKKAWKIHYPHFKYEQYAQEVATIFKRAHQEDIHHKDMRLYIYNNMVAK
ncbi:MAG: hypothetical protein U9R50_00875 [Campylobacterota bacterium]|nr:hypothetical protein [Campylobacterota bacterium]